MPRRKTVQEKEIEALSKKHLDAIGEAVSQEAAKNSKKRTGDLIDSQNYRTRPYNVLTVSQNFYGKYNTPKGKATPKDRSNIKDTPLKNAIKRHVPEGTKLFIKDMIDLITAPIVTKK